MKGNRSIYKQIQNNIPYYIFFINNFTRFFRFMRNRPAYTLKRLLAAYNLAQVAACASLILAILHTDFTTIKFWQCQSVDYRTNDKSIRVLTLTYYTFLLKLVELVETVFFVLRKKENQISKLHVYHHASTAILGWLMVKYIGGELKLFDLLSVKRRAQRINFTIIDHILIIRFQLYVQSFQAAWCYSQSYWIHLYMLSCTAIILLHCLAQQCRTSWPKWKWA